MDGDQQTSGRKERSKRQLAKLRRCIEDNDIIFALHLLQSGGNSTEEDTITTRLA
jgi:hypothetical protein